MCLILVEVGLPSSSTLEVKMDRMMRVPEVVKVVGVSTATLRNMIRDGVFPAPIKISRQAIAWSESTISDWLQAKIDETEERNRR